MVLNGGEFAAFLGVHWGKFGYEESEAHHGESGVD